MSLVLLGVAVGLCAFAALVIAPRCFFRVDEGHRAVLTSFGRARRDASKRLVAFGPGLHTKAPWERCHVVKTMEQGLDLSGERGGTTAMASDGMLLRFDSILRYQIEDAALERWLFGLERPIEHTTGLFTALLRNEIAGFGADDDGGSYARIRRERRQLSVSIERFCKKEIGDAEGLTFNAVDLTDILPPDELADALNAVIRARNEAETAFALAEADCARRVLAAEHGVEVATQKGKAVELEIKELARFLAELDENGTLDTYVARRKAEVLSQSRTLFLGSAA